MLLPLLRGPAPWAIILCRFRDVPPLNIPKSKFFDLVSESGRGGLFDYWRDVSYGTISLAGSEMFGWYTMKYSFVTDGLDPFKDQHLPLKDQQKVRLAWINEAKRLAQENGVDLSRFYGVIAVVNAKVDDSNYGLDMAFAVGGAWGQTNWRWCNKCQGLTFAGNPTPGACPAGGVHDHSGSGDYTIAINSPGSTGQSLWKRCRKCRGLHYNGNPPCPAGGVHDHSGTWDYALAINDVSFPGQTNWRWCNKCQGLSFAGNPTPGACPAGGVHDHSGSGNYSLLHDIGSEYAQNNWSWCNKCQGLSFAGNPTPGACPAGGVHDHSGSWDYALANFVQDVTYLIGFFQSGQTFTDSTRKVRIAVDSIDSLNSTATITIGNPITMLHHSNPRINAPL